MKEGELIYNTLEGLKKRLSNNRLVVQGDRGFVCEVEFIFNPPATVDEVNAFCRRVGFELPKDYSNFIQMHNGAKLFKPWFGGGVELFSLDEIIENKLDYMPDHWYPIAYFIDGGYLLIDANKCKNGEKDYLIWLDSFILEEAENLQINFEIWLDRYVIAQGEKYWTWKRYTVHNYYKTHR